MIESMEKAQTMVAYWRSHPCEAAKDILGVDLEPHQRHTLNLMWFNDTQTNIMSRGTGKTFLNGVSASLEGILKPGHRIGLIGPSFRQSKLIWDEVSKLYNKSPLFQQAVKKEPAITPEKAYLIFHSAEGKNQSVIEALPLGTDGSKIRGARYFSTYIDEGAQIDKEILDVVVRGFGATSANPVERANFIQEQKRMLAEGLITKDQFLRPPSNKEIFSTTAFFQYNHAYERVCKLVDVLQRRRRKAEKSGGDLSKFVFGGTGLNNNQIPYRIMTDGREGLAAFTCMDVREGFMDMQSIARAKREMSEYKFLMEYFSFFPPDSEGFFRRSLLDSARNHGQFGCVFGPRLGCHYTIGVDPARYHDNFAISLFEVDPVAEEIRLVRVFAWNNKKFPESHRRVRDILKKFGVNYWQMDSGGGGTTIRDLLADTAYLSAGERLILEKEFDEHRTLVGDRSLGKLIEFSSYEWVQNANFNLKSALEHKRLKIASQSPYHGQVFTSVEDAERFSEADKEIDDALTEWSSIVTTSAGARVHWDTPTKTMRKDRYSSILIGYDAAEKLMATLKKPKKLAFGTAVVRKDY